MWKKTRYKSIYMIIGFTALVAFTVIMTVLSSRTEDQQSPVPSVDPSQRPSATPTATMSPPSEKEVIIIEDGNRPLNIRADGRYVNELLPTIETGFGMRLQIGLDQPDVTDAIYINPHFTYDYAGNPNEQYGYLLRTERVPLDYADTEAAPADAEKNSVYTDLAIFGRIYDKVVSAVTENSSRYGVRWIDSSAYGGKDHDGDMLHILIIRLSDGTLMGAGRANISYNYAENSYRLENFINCDVRYTRELSDSWRHQIFKEATEFLETGNDSFSIGFHEPNWEEAEKYSVVEKTPTVYFSKLFDENGNVISAGRLKNIDIYAVNINWSGYGFFTVYFAPEPMSHGLHVRQMGDEELNLVAVGYDAFRSLTEATLASHLHAEDTEVFVHA